jgi:hypothetical protein
MDRSKKKEALREYKERKQSPGIFAVRCAATGQVWTGASPNLQTQQNGIWFQLKLGGYPNAALQSAWKQHGETAFAFETLEAIVDDNPLLIRELLKERQKHWREKLGAEKVVG